MLQSGENLRNGAEIVCFPHLFCARMEWQKRQHFRSKKKIRHFSLRLPADRRHSCSQHGCEITRAENFTTFPRTFAIVCALVYRCLMFVCGPYKDIRVAYVWIKGYGAMSVIHSE